MTCREVSGLLSSYLDEELDPESNSHVEAHLEICGYCRAVLEELRQVKSALRSLPVLEPPPGLHARIMQAVSEAPAAQPGMAEVESSPKRGWFPWKTPSTRRTGFKTVAMALAACLVIMILSSAGTLFLTRRYFSPWPRKSIGRTFTEVQNDGYSF